MQDVFSALVFCRTDLLCVIFLSDKISFANYQSKTTMQIMRIPPLKRLSRLICEAEFSDEGVFLFKSKDSCSFQIKHKREDNVNPATKVIIMINFQAQRS